MRLHAMAGLRTKTEGAEETKRHLATSNDSKQGMHMRRYFLSDEAKEKVWRPAGRHGPWGSDGAQANTDRSLLAPRLEGPRHRVVTAAS